MYARRTRNQRATAGSRHLKPACSKCRSVVKASEIPCSDITMKLTQSTRPQALSSRSAYNSNARLRRSGVTCTMRTTGFASIRRTASGKSGRTVVRARLLPVSAMIQSVRTTDGLIRPSCLHVAAAHSCSSSRVFNNATHPLESKKTESATIRHLGMAVEIMVKIHGQVGYAGVSRQFIHSPNRVEVRVIDDCWRPGFNADGRSLRQLDRRFKHDDAVFDYSVVAHSTAQSTAPSAALANQQVTYAQR